MNMLLISVSIQGVPPPLLLPGRGQRPPTVRGHVPQKECNCECHLSGLHISMACHQDLIGLSMSTDPLVTMCTTSIEMSLTPHSPMTSCE